MKNNTSDSQKRIQKISLRSRATKAKRPTHSLSPKERVLKVDDWPDQDYQAWCAGLLPGDILEGERYAEELRPTTLRNSKRGYGRWLKVVSELDPAALELHPAERVVPARARLFLNAMQGSGNCNNTIRARFWELRSALRIMYPDRDFRWVNKPGGIPLVAMLPTTQRARQIIDIRELARWGEDLMRQGLRADADPRMEWFRNGLLVALLANSAPRQRSLASLQLGCNIFRRGDQFQLAFRAEDMKRGKPLEHLLPERLTPRIDHYLEVVRPRLLAGQSHDWFWVNRDGNRLKEIGIEGVIRRGSVARFGWAIRTHAFRHSLATTGMILDPTSPRGIAALLGNSPYAVQHHYDLGGQIEASRRWQSILEEICEMSD